MPYSNMIARKQLNAYGGGPLLLGNPLNVQTGQEEGHQGGVRYEPEDEGYRVLRNWVLRQTRLQTGGS
ncbi:MAG: hypothetical protein OXN97_12975 [Bryobacterales bacterium]|nr:hypothetical protein [Bryobacterales bacterium]